MNSIQILLNGKPVECIVGERLIDVIQRSNVELAAVCYHPQLGPVQTCDTCVVECQGELIRACSTVVQADMDLSTNSDRAATARRDAFDQLLTSHQLYCTVCDNNNGNCVMHNTTKLLQIEGQTRPFEPKPYEVDESNPFYRYDPDQCLLCGRCVEACQNIEVNETLSINWEDPNPRVLWDGGVPIGQSSCVSCGHCVTVCPCNALMEKSMLGHAGFLTGVSKKTLDGMIDIVKEIEPETGFRSILRISEAESAMRQSRIRRTKTVCTYCGVGCSFEVWTKDRHILKIEPEHGPVNGISTCIKGKFGWDFVNSKDRLTHPLIREGESFREATWDEAFTYIADNLRRIRKTHGADAIGVISSSKCSNEESFLMQKLARAIIGTNNVDNCSRYCQAPATAGLFRTVGYGGDSGSVTDIAQADLVIIIGSNTTESHPVIATRIKRAHKLHGQKLIVADLRSHEMARRADLFIRPRPGTDLIWLSAITRYILDHDLAADSFLEQWVNNLDEFRESLEPFSLEFAEEKTGIPIQTLTKIAQMVAQSPRVAICWAMGVTQHSMGSDTSTAISNLLLVTGNYMRAGTGAYPLRGHNNVQGASDMGSMPNMLPGYQPVEDIEVRERFESAWGTTLPTTKGLDNHEMIHAILDGRLRAMYLCGEEMSLVDADANLVQKAFSQLDFMIVQDVFFSHTCQFANIVLPASPSLEKDGTFTNTERRIQRFYQVFEPLGESRPDWRIVQGIANELGAMWTYQHPSEIMAEAASLTPLLSGVSFERLEGYQSQQWPVAEDGSDQSILYENGFAFTDSKARLHPVSWNEPVDQPNDEYDLHLNNGNLLEHFHEGNLTYLVPGIREKTPDVFVEVSPELASKRGITNGTRVELTSRYGQVSVRALVTDRVQGNQLFMPMNSSDSPVNMLIGANTDPVTHTPAYKESSVRMRVLHEEDSPLPNHNFRFGRPTPQDGVEVHRKWSQSNASNPVTLYQIQSKIS
ncbi:formate dehydrogenase subunit alpha [Bremerella alba]|uniref:nitrate reductase (cytochrome) n=1 Tax=Bremerella alba TaxID=980252 RepID=A0A7V9A8I6_9BACT|nr:formate dehydrogenase subunit alpha [Bremerella alba]MBA2116076.1 putative formate dehydrogenase [Bremerella alba]